jgi:hypothetical protein
VRTDPAKEAFVPSAFACVDEIRSSVLALNDWAPPAITKMVRSMRVLVGRLLLLVQEAAAHLVRLVASGLGVRKGVTWNRWHATSPLRDSRLSIGVVNGIDDRSSGWPTREPPLRLSAT